MTNLEMCAAILGVFHCLNTCTEKFDLHLILIFKAKRSEPVDLLELGMRELSIVVGLFVCIVERVTEVDLFIFAHMRVQAKVV